MKVLILSASVILIAIIILMLLYQREGYVNTGYMNIPVDTINYPAFYTAGKKKSRT